MKERNKIGLGAAIIIGINAMIGAGVVAMPATLSAAGPAGIISYVAAIAFAMLIGLSLAHLAELFPGSGWSYIYPEKWGGHKIGMFSAFCYLIGVLIAMGFIVQQTGIWLHDYFFSGLHYNVVAFGLDYNQIFSAIILFLLTILVLAGAEASSFGQYVIAAFVLIPLGLTAIVAWLNIKLTIISNFMPHGIKPVLETTPKALYTLMGFESIASLYTIVQNPKKNVAKACMIAIFSVGSVYIFFAAGILFSIPNSYFAKGLGESLANVIRYAFPSYPYLALFVLVGGLFAMIGTLHSMLWSLASLSSDVLKKSRSRIIKLMLEKKIWNDNSAVILISTTMLLSAIFIQAESILLTTICFIVMSYLLSISLLLFQKKEWKTGKNIRTVFAMLGGFAMLYYAIKGIFFI